MINSRRTFLKSIAMATATSVAHRAPASSGAGPCAAAGELPDLAGVKWEKAPCRFCGTGCHVQVGVEDGKVVAVAGDPKADVNKGLLCVKGYHVGSIL